MRAGDNLLNSRRVPFFASFRMALPVGIMLGKPLLMRHDQIRRVPAARCTLLAAMLSMGIEAGALAQSAAFAPTPPTTSPVSVAAPEPIYWKQMLFQIPYQWGSAAEPGAAQVVWLLVSKDHGGTWQKISEAKPHVKSFNYRAEGEGEYWFAVRTLDYQGRAWPAGEYHPELRVIVDTTMPRIELLQANLLSDGSVDIQWHGADLHLDPNSWRIEAQRDASGDWQPVPLVGAGSTEQGAGSVNPNLDVGAATSTSTGRIVWQPPVGRLPVAIRATVLDRAGNSATFRTEIKPAASSAVAYQRLPPTNAASALPANTPLTNLFDAPHMTQSPSARETAPTNSPPQGWVSSSATTVVGAQQPQATDQIWPADSMARAPFRLSSSGAVAPDDAVTAYGNPSGAAGPIDMNFDKDDNQRQPSPTDRYALNAEPPAMTETDTSLPLFAGPAFQPVPPFRQASVSRLPTSTVDDPPYSNDSGTTGDAVVGGNQPPWDAYAGHLPPEVRPKLVGSRTFALEYDLEEIGRWGVSKVELWGTRDGGQTWRSYARDEDQRSPLIVTVDEEGVYGFRIVVESAGSAAAVPPSPGEAPELWVAVDLKRPIADLTAIEPGAGNFADHLSLEWRADDDNLEPRPISLFYSSRPTGPWSAIATNLENTGQYSWRVERHVPTRFYLRLEARDTAGNLAAFQTREPIEFAPPAASGRLRSAAPADPTATGGGVSYR